jgi:hypothetical protein
VCFASGRFEERFSLVSPGQQFGALEQLHEPASPAVHIGAPSVVDALGDLGDGQM